MAKAFKRQSERMGNIIFIRCIFIIDHFGYGRINTSFFKRIYNANSALVSKRISNKKKTEI